MQIASLEIRFRCALSVNDILRPSPIGPPDDSRCERPRIRWVWKPRGVLLFKLSDQKSLGDDNAIGHIIHNSRGDDQPTRPLAIRTAESGSPQVSIPSGLHYREFWDLHPYSEWVEAGNRLRLQSLFCDLRCDQSLPVQRCRTSVTSWDHNPVIRYIFVSLCRLSMRAEIPRIQTEFVGYWGCRFYVSIPCTAEQRIRAFLVFHPSKSRW